MHTVQQTEDFHRYSSSDGCGCACCCAGWGAQKTVEFRSCRSSGVCAMVGSIMDTCSVSSRVVFGRIFKIFYVIGRTRLLRLILVALCNMADEEVAVLVVNSSSGLRLLVLLVMHLALCSRRLPAVCRDVHSPFFFCSRAALGNLYIISTSLLYFQHFPQSKFCASRFFWGPSSTHSCECSRAGGAGVVGSLLPGDSAPETPCLNARV